MDRLWPLRQLIETKECQMRWSGLAVLFVLTGCPQLDSGLDPRLQVILAAGSAIADVANVRVDLDPGARDPITALGACADAVVNCYAPPDRDLASCVEATRTCDTDTPWTEKKACCPSKCKAAFTDAVASGLLPREALDQVLFAAPDCFPGVRSALEGR